MKTHISEDKTWREVDFFLKVCGEKHAGNGEDSFLYYLGEDCFVAGVFDGCGGAGARKYPGLQNKTGAYLASRIACGTVKDCAKEGLFTSKWDETGKLLKAQINDNLRMAKREAGDEESMLTGSLMKEFPTTISVFTGAPTEGEICARCFWAGDSRCYYLDAEGLHQLTVDDVRSADAMENLLADSGLTNMISLTKDYKIHNRDFRLPMPGILFSATDGCFSYYSTPMEFEYLLLHTLMEATSVREWEKRIEEELWPVSGDDFTLVGISVGFSSIEVLREKLLEREKFLYSKFIDSIGEKELEEKRLLWAEYKPAYLAYLD